MIKNLVCESVLSRNGGTIIGSVISPLFIMNHLTYTGLYGDLERLTIETRVISESFECVLGECEI